MMLWHIMKNILDQIFHFQTWKEVQIKLLSQCIKLVSIKTYTRFTLDEQMWNIIHIGISHQMLISIALGSII